MINLTSFDIEVPIPYPNASVGAGYPAAPPNVTRSLRKGYYAAVTFTDWNIGLALDELERLGAKKCPLFAPFYTPNKNDNFVPRQARNRHGKS